jgi:signal peptidase II
VTRRVAARFAAIVVLVIGVDQATKAAVRALLDVGESVGVISGLLSLTHVSNTGAAFGFFPGRMPFFIATASVVLFVIVWVLWRHRITNGLLITALSLVFGGAAGNLIDRVVGGGVTDFIDVQIWPVFNVADIALDLGVALLILHLLFSRGDSVHD